MTGMKPNAVELIVEVINKNPESTFHGDRFDIPEDDTKQSREFHPSRFKFLYYGMTWPNHPSMFVHKETYQYYNTSLKKSFSD
jgi:hypothetical protein